MRRINYTAVSEKPADVRSHAKERKVQRKCILFDGKVLGKFPGFPYGIVTRDRGIAIDRVSNERVVSAVLQYKQIKSPVSISFYFYRRYKVPRA